MSFQEKSRWAGLAANLLIWGWYFIDAFQAWHDGSFSGRGSFGGIVGAIILSVVVQVALTTAMAIHRPNEAEAALDERDRQISRRGSATAYSLLSFGMVLVIGAAYLAIDYLTAINLLLLVFITVECVRYVIEISAYRRGWHG